MIRNTANALIAPTSEGTKTNPASGDLLADTGALAAGRYQVHVGVGASAAAVVSLQRRNAANDGNVGSALVKRVPAGASSEFIWVYTVVADERLRVVMQDTLAGDAEAAIQLEKLG